MGTVISTARRLEYARGYLELGMVREAGKELEAVDPEDRLLPEVRAGRLDLFLAKGKWKSMAETARGLAADFPEVPQWWVHWAYGLREMDRVEEARDVALRGLDRHPGEVILHYNLACYLSLLGDLDEAKNSLTRCFSLDERFKQEAMEDPDLNGLRPWMGEG